MHLEIQGLTKLYKHERGLLPTSFGVASGDLVAVVGPNGAGKSTLLKMLADWVLPDAGRAVLDGVDLRNRPALGAKVGFIPEEPNLFENFSVEYNLRLFAALFRLPAARAAEILRDFELLPFRGHLVRELSKGLKQRVSIGRALLADPPVLLFDEPTSGLDFEMTREIHRWLHDMHAAGKTILFASHRPDEIKDLATRVLVLHEGRLVFDGPAQEYFGSGVRQDVYA